jgi:Protein of unknown function (DUF2442)
MSLVVHFTGRNHLQDTTVILGGISMIFIDKAVTILGVDGWLLIDFTNGSKKFVDTKPHMKGILEKLKDPEFFSKVYVDDELTTINWLGELDLDPDQLHREGIDLHEIKKIIEVAKNTNLLERA